MSRAQTAVKKGRASSSSKSKASAKSRRAGASRRPVSRRTETRRASAMAGGKGKGRNRQGRQGSASRAANQRAREDADSRAAMETPRAETSRSRGRTAEPEAGDARRKPEGNVPPTARGPDATVAEQRRAQSREPLQDERHRRPPQQAAAKPGSRGGGGIAVARDADELDEGHGDLAEPARASTRGPDAQGGEEGKRARARRAGLGFRDDE